MLPRRPSEAGAFVLAPRQETMELDYNERGIPEADRVVLRQRHQALKPALMDMLEDSKKGRR
jgi:hypothetical protein